MTSDDARMVLNDDGSDTSGHVPDASADHLSDVAPLIPWSTEFEIWTEAGKIRRKIETLGGYDQGADKVLQSSNLSSPGKTSYKDTNDSHGGATHVNPIAEHSKSPQQLSLPIVQRVESSQVQWSEEHQRFYKFKYNFTARMYCM